MAKRELLRKIDQEPGQRNTSGTFVSGGGGATAHRMLSPTHSDSDASDVPVNDDLMVFDSLWKALTLAEVIDLIGGLFVGRLEGAHAGLFAYDHEDGTAIEFQVTDTGGQPFVSIGEILDVPNTSWLRIGYPEYDQITLTDPTSGATDPEQHRPLSIPTSALVGYLPASQVSIVDAGNFFTSADVEAALQELAGDPPVRIATDTTSETGPDRNGVIVCNKASEMAVYLLPAAGTGRHLTVKNIGAGTVIVDAFNVDTIDGETMQYLNQFDAAQIVDYTTSAWGII